MDCIFKVLGYVPEHKFCMRCEPLHVIFRSLGYDDEKASKAADIIFRTYAVLRADDVIRDERSPIKRCWAKLVKKVCSLGLSNELKDVVEKADATIRRMESANIDESGYIEGISIIGGEVFQAALGDKDAFSVGKTLSAAMTMHDMAKDLREDKRRNRFNPLKTAPSRTLVMRLTQSVNSLMPNANLLGSKINTYNLETDFTSEGCAQSCNTCVGVCAGICSSLLLYRLCCS